MNASHKLANYFLDEVSEVKHQQTLQKVKKRSPFNSRTVGGKFLKPIKHIIKRILSMYYTFKPEVQLFTCATRHFNVQIQNLFQHQGDQGIKAPAKIGSRLASKSYDSAKMDQLVRILKTANDSAAYSDVKCIPVNNFKQYGEKTTGKNMEVLEGTIYQIVRECLMAAVDLVPGLGSLLYGAYNVWNWSMQVTELVNRNQIALCIRKFIEKKFWDWIETDKYH
jgi:hypothetical protein